MTNEEKLYQIFPDGVCPFSRVWLSEEYQEPITKNDLGVDCVSRQEVDRLARIYLKEPTDNHVAFYEDFLELSSVTLQKPEIVPIAEIKYDEDKLKELVNKCVLTVTPQEPKTGHWIANAPQYDMLNPQYICSECGNAHTRTTPYCEMCGAKMVEPQEREDNG